MAVPFEAVQGNNTTPLVDGSTVFYTGQGKGLFAMKIEPQGGGFAATPLWTNTQLGTRFTTPVLKEGLLYGYNGGFFCASAQTGATLWTDATKRGQSAAMLDAGSVILALTLNGELAAFKPEQHGIRRTGTDQGRHLQNMGTPGSRGKEDIREGQRDGELVDHRLVPDILDAGFNNKNPGLSKPLHYLSVASLILLGSLTPRSWVRSNAPLGETSAEYALTGS